MMVSYKPVVEPRSLGIDLGLWSMTGVVCDEARVQMTDRLLGLLFLLVVGVVVVVGDGVRGGGFRNGQRSSIWPGGMDKIRKGRNM